MSAHPNDRRVRWVQAMVGAALLISAGCYAAPVKTQAPPASRAAEIAPLPASYEGELPCADCPGIIMRLALYDDHTFNLLSIYRERGVVRPEAGTWSVSPDGLTLSLVIAGAERQMLYAVRGADVLTQLDIEGKPIESTLNFDLTRVLDVPLEGPVWTLVQLGSESVNRPAGAPDATLQFQKDGARVAGSTGCNRLSGGYEDAEGRFTLQRLVTTRMACAAGMDLEQPFLDALARVTAFRIVGRTLELLDAAGVPLLRFHTA